MDSISLFPIGSLAVKETQSKLEKDNRELLNEISNLNKKLKEKEDIITSKDAKIDVITRYVACIYVLIRIKRNTFLSLSLCIYILFPGLLSTLSGLWNESTRQQQQAKNQNRLRLKKAQR